jgi:hypothetical protein
MTNGRHPVRILLRGVALAVLVALLGAGITFLLLAPGAGEALSGVGLPPFITSLTARLVAALTLAVALGLAAAFVLFAGCDRDLGLVVRALQGSGEDADESEAGGTGPGDLREIADRVVDCRRRARQAEVARRRLQDSVRGLAAAIEERAAETLRPLDATAYEDDAERILVNATGNLVESARRLREMAGVLLVQVEDDLATVSGPLDEAARRAGEGLAAVESAAAALKEILARRTRDGEPAAREDPTAGGVPPGADLLRDELERALRDAGEAAAGFAGCRTALAAAQRAATRVGREVGAVRRRVGEGDVERLTEANFVTGESTDAADSGGDR